MKSNTNKLLILVLVTLFMVTTFVVAQPPWQSSGEQLMGLTIIYPKFDYYPFAPVTPHIHVFNGTGFLVSDAECTLHIYNNTGNHVFQGNFTPDSNGLDYYINLTQPFINLTIHDWYSFTTWCTSEDNNQAGFLSGAFQMTHQGETSVPNNNGLFYIPIAMVLLIFVFLKLYTLISEKHESLRILIIFFIPPLLVGTVGYILTLTNTFVGSGIALWFYKASNWFSYLFIFYIVIAVLVSTLNGLIKLKNAHK
jgi:hypothetical protein